MTIDKSPFMSALDREACSAVSKVSILLHEVVELAYAVRCDASPVADMIQRAGLDETILSRQKATLLATCLADDVNELQKMVLDADALTIKLRLQVADLEEKS